MKKPKRPEHSGEDAKEPSQETKPEKATTGSAEIPLELTFLRLARLGTSFDDAAKVIESADAARRRLRLEAARGSAEKFGDFRDMEKLVFRMLTTSALTGIPTSAALKALLTEPEFVEEVDKNFPRFVRRLHNFMRQKETPDKIKRSLVRAWADGTPIAPAFSLLTNATIATLLKHPEGAIEQHVYRLSLHRPEAPRIKPEKATRIGAGNKWRIRRKGPNHGLFQSNRDAFMDEALRFFDSRFGMQKTVKSDLQDSPTKADRGV